MRVRSLSQLESLGLLEPKATGREMVAGWQARSREDLRLVRDVLAYDHMEKAVGIVYEAGYRACAGLLGLAGYRVRSIAGHHRAASEGAGAVLGEGFEGPLRRLDRAAGSGTRASTARHHVRAGADLDQLLDDVEGLLDELGRCLEEAEARPDDEE